MSIISGPNSISSGLVLHLDAASSRSYDSGENLFTNSNDFTTATWTVQEFTNSAAFTTATVIAPDNSLTGTKVYINSASSFYSIFRSATITSSTNYAFSIYFRPVEVTQGSMTIYTTANNTIVFNLLTNAITGSTIPDPNFTLLSSTITPVNNSWSRVSFNFRHNIPGLYQFKYNLNNNLTGNNGFFVWGAQLESNNDAGPYYPTTSVAKVRSTTWTDLSGNGNNATFYNRPGYKNNAVQFRSACNQYAISSFDQGVLKQTNQTGTWTIEVLFLHAAASSPTEAVVAGRAGCHGGIYQYSDNSLRHAIKTNNTVSCWINATEMVVTSLTTGTGYHSTMVYNNGVIFNYINGSFVNSSTFRTSGAAYDMTNYTNNFHIGGIDYGSYKYLTNADISMVKCYSRALSNNEVYQNFNAVRSRMGI